MRQKGFTLIELASVLAVIFVILAVVVWVINPQKMLAKSRDERRINDVTALVTALNLYQADKKDFTGLVGPYLSTDGVDWLPINFSNISSGKPFDHLPLDPLNNKSYHYVVGVDVIHKTYEVNCVFENDDNLSKETSDGGNNTSVYEMGTDLTILK